MELIKYIMVMPPFPDLLELSTGASSYYVNVLVVQK
jgi:hypothetical protein